MTETAIRVTIWNEFIHEREQERVKAIYPDGIHTALAVGLEKLLGNGVQIQLATLEQPSHGLTEDVLAATDVLLWWGHMAHDQVSDSVVESVKQRVLSGMGLIVLHSGHAAKIFQALMGTGCMLRWREAAERERLWVVSPGHPIVAGLPEEYIELPEAEMYGEFFDIPEPDELVFISWFAGGEVFRSGCTFRRGAGRIFYFRPGHETYPIYHNSQIQRVISNAVKWACPASPIYRSEARNIVEPLEDI